MSWFGWFDAKPRPPIKEVPEDPRERYERTLAQLVILCDERQKELDNTHEYMTQLKAETARLEQLPTVKKLRARIDALTETKRWMSQQLQDAHKRAENAMYEQRMATEYNVKMGSR